MANPKLSEDAKLYYNNGTYGSPTWVLICNVKDLTLSMEHGETDVTTRCGAGFREYVAGLTDVTIDFGMIYDPSDTAWEFLRAAFFDKSAEEFLILDGPNNVAGSEGLRLHAFVKSFTRNETLGEALMTDVSLRPTANANAAPAWYTA
jgi:hypothetical protein